MGVIAEFYAKIGGDASGLHSTLKTVDTMLGKLGTNFKNFSGISISSFALIAGGAVSAGKALLELADDAMKYSLQVADMARITGASAESTSGLIQAADDARVSYEALMTSMRIATKQGVDTSLEGMQKLAEQYNAIQEPIERSQFLLEKFGRSGLEMGKLLEQGAAGIAASAEAAKKYGLVIDQKAIDSAKKYYAELDNLGDAWEGLRMKVGNGVIPIILSFITVEEDATQVTKTNLDIQRDALEQYSSMGYANEALTERYRLLTNEIYEANQAEDMQAYYMRQAERATQDASGAVEELETKLYDLSNVDMNFASTIASAIEGLGIRGAGGEKLQDIFNKILEVTPKIGEQMASDMMGPLFIANQQLQVELGNITTTDAAKNIRDELGVSLTEAFELARDTKTYLESLRSKEIDVIINRWYFDYYNAPQSPRNMGGSRDADIALAAGGYAPGGGILVGERGPEVLSPNMSGYVTPNESASIRLDRGSMEELAKLIADKMVMARA